MKRTLLITAAFVSCSLVASIAFAESPKVTVGGFADFQLGIANDDYDSGMRSYGFRNDTEVNFSVDGVAGSGLKYGAEIGLEADVTADEDGQGLNASRTYLYLEGNWGRFELGSNEGADQSLKVDASNIARATGGIDGDFRYFDSFVNNNPSIFDYYLITPDLPVMSLETTNNDNKITYYSPRFSGFQIGVSFAPNMIDSGQYVGRLDNIPGFFAEDILSGGLNYEGQFDQVRVTASATGEWGNASDSAYQDLRAYALGAKLTYAGFSLAGSWGDWTDSLTIKSAAFDSDYDYWTLGLAYDGGTYGVSATYLSSSTTLPDSFTGNIRSDTEFKNFVVGADYKLAPGMTPYIEASFFEYESRFSFENDGYVVLVGSQLAF